MRFGLQKLSFIHTEKNECLYDGDGYVRPLFFTLWVHTELLSGSRKNRKTILDFLLHFICSITFIPLYFIFDMVLLPFKILSMVKIQRG